MLLAEKGDDMNVIGHNDEYKQLNLPRCSQVMETVNDNPFNNITPKQMRVINCCRSDEIEVVRIENWFNWHNAASMLPQGLRPCG